MPKQQIHLPPGDYYIGDPCYVIDGDRWHDFLEPYWTTDRGGVFEFDNEKVCAYSTQYGDGAYECSAGGMLGVDAGIIGAIPMGIITGGDPEGMGTVVEFTEPFTCSRDDDGRLHFGHVEVMTGDEEEDYD